MAQKKDFTASRAASRLHAAPNEEEVVFGAAANQPDKAAASASRDEGAEAPSAARKQTSCQYTKNVTVLLDEDLFWRMKSYLASRECAWRGASDMLRSLLEKELDRAGK